jgi:hypothetical protein
VWASHKQREAEVVTQIGHRPMVPSTAAEHGYGAKLPRDVAQGNATYDSQAIAHST